MANLFSIPKFKSHNNEYLFFCLANLIIKDENLKKFNRSQLFKNYYCKIIIFNKL
jgi:hypothetical protein